MKRYVLLENKEIIDRTKAQEFNVYDREPIKLQSDNLIDLLEVGDCVEFTSGSISYIVSDDNMTYMTTNFKEIIVAIWKRNGGIMRRYEV